MTDDERKEGNTMTKCERDDCQERVFPGMMSCEADHQQAQAAPVPPEMAIQSAMFDLQMRLYDKSDKLKPETRAYMKAHLDGLNAAARLIQDYRAVVAALETLKSVL